MDDRTWIVVANSAQARVLRPGSKGRGVEEVKTLTHPESRLHERDIVTDKEGRTFNSCGPGRHAMSADTATKKHEAQRFCRELAGEIEQARTSGQFDSLILVAAPAFLGELRKTLSAPCVRLIVAEVDKDVAHLPPREIETFLPV